MKAATALIWLCAVASAGAQTLSPVPAPKKQQIAAPKITAGCDTGRKFGGPDDTALLIEAIGNIDFSKKELETTSEWRKRVEADRAYIDKRFAIDGQLMFTVAIGDDKFSYDADAATLKLQSFTGLLGRNADGSISIRFSALDVGTFEASNAFGVKILVTKKRGVDVRITAKPLSLQQMTHRRQIKAPMQRDDAKTMRIDVVVLLLVKLKEPYITKEKAHVSPRFDFPYDYETDQQTIHAEITCAALLNNRTHQVIKSIGLSEL